MDAGDGGERGEKMMEREEFKKRKQRWRTKKKKKSEGRETDDWKKPPCDYRMQFSFSGNGASSCVCCGDI